MENGVCQELDGGEIRWKFQEILQLLRYFKEYGFNFPQIAIKMKEDKKLASYPKDHYTSDACESAFRKILEMSKDKPYYVELFKTINYSEQGHGLKLLEQYEEYYMKITEFVDKTLLNDKFKSMLVAMEKGELSPEMADKLEKFCKAFPSLANMAVGIEQYDKIMEKKSIFETLMPERGEIASFQEIQVTLNAKCEEYKVQQEAIAAAEAKAAAIAKAVAEAKAAAEAKVAAEAKAAAEALIIASAPSTSKAPPHVSLQSSRFNIDMKQSKSTPAVDGTSKKKSRHSSTTNQPLSKSLTSDTPRTKKKRTPDLKLDATETSVNKSSSTKDRHPSVSSKKSSSDRKKSHSSVSSKKASSVQENLKARDTRDATTQTYFSLVDKLDETDTPLLVEKCKNLPGKKGNKKTRTVMTQTGKIKYVFRADMDTIQWYDDGDVLDEMTKELLNSCLRSNIDYEIEIPIRVNMNVKEKDTVTNPYIEELKKHPLYELFLDIKQADNAEYFRYPVKLEVPDYPSYIKTPMDLLTIEDLMVQGKIKDIDDLEFYTSLMTTNAVVFGVISKYAERLAKKFAEIFKEYRSKNQK